MLSQVTAALRQEGMLSIVDIVLNHTAHDSHWIADHPEACHSTDASPHLWSAWLLDKALRDFSDAFALKNVPSLPFAPYIANETDLAAVLHHIRTKVIAPLRLQEFFMCDVDRVMA